MSRLLENSFREFNKKINIVIYVINLWGIIQQEQKGFSFVATF